MVINAIFLFNNTYFLFCCPLGSGILFVIICESINNANFYSLRIENNQLPDNSPTNIETILNFGQYICLRRGEIYIYSRFC